MFHDGLRVDFDKKRDLAASTVVTQKAELRTLVKMLNECIQTAPAKRTKIAEIIVTLSEKLASGRLTDQKKIPHI